MEPVDNPASKSSVSDGRVNPARYYVLSNHAGFVVRQAGVDRAVGIDDLSPRMLAILLADGARVRCASGFTLDSILNDSKDIVARYAPTGKTGSSAQKRQNDESLFRAVMDVVLAEAASTGEEISQDQARAMTSMLLATADKRREVARTETVMAARRKYTGAKPKRLTDMLAASSDKEPAQEAAD